MSNILFEVNELGVGVLTINRPEVHNALNWAAMSAFTDAVELAHDAVHEPGCGLRVLIVTGAGGSFASGGDVFELQAYPSRSDGLRLATRMGNALARLEALPCPTIAAIHGPARGGGAEITLACDIRLMAQDTTIGFVQSRLGIITAWGGGQRLLRTVGYGRALDLMATGRVVSADEALAIGLINRVTAPGDTLQAAHHLAEEIAANPPAATQAAKRVLRLGLTTTEELALEGERAEFPDLWDTEFRRDAVRRFLAKRSKPELVGGVRENGSRAR
jgi:enoyl-CoA hydratase/carnithine racemase